MKTFKELSADVAISQQLDRRDLPNDLKEYLNKSEFDTLLKKLRFDETKGRDNLGFPQNDFIRMLDNKVHVASNILSYERNIGGNNGNVWYPKVRYVIYYLQQEPNYLQRYPQKSNLKRCDCNCRECDGSQIQNIY